MPGKKIKIQKTKEVLERYCQNIFPSPQALIEFLERGQKLKIYLGIDATGTHIHFGHATNLLVLQHLQEEGHQIIILVGDFTGQVGDPTDKLSARVQLDKKQVQENYKTFKQQVGTILKLTGKNPVVFKKNSAWLEKMTFAKVVQLAQNVTVQQMIERDMFQERLKQEKPIFLHEFLYPLMQGYDSVALDVNAEIGGTDQTFNMLMGRELLGRLKQKEKFVLTTKLLVNPETGKKLMNKSEGGMINLDDTPADIFGKVMSLSDEAMFPIGLLSSKMDLALITLLQERIRKGDFNPRDAKLQIAHAVVATLHGEKVASRQLQEFIETFSQKKIGENAFPLKIKESSVSLLELVVKTGVAPSNSQARRLIEQGGVELAGTVTKNPNAKIEVGGGEILRVGKRNFFRLEK